MATGIQRIFAEVPETYDLINHLMTLGFDILWRRKAADIAVSHGGTRWLDVCCGTGDMSINLARRAQKQGNGCHIFCTDFSLPMLSVLLGKTHSQHLEPSLSDVRFLPFRDESFDVVTISFATRNLNVSRERLIATFREFARVLRPGGHFINLETSQPRSRFMRAFMHGYVALTVRRLGRLISGSDEAYTYLSRTIPRFYPPDELSEILREAGFATVTHHPLMAGIAAIHDAQR